VAEEEEDDDDHEHARHRVVPPAAEFLDPNGYIEKSIFCMFIIFISLSFIESKL